MINETKFNVTFYRDGNTIFATCGDKTAKAVCSPDDEFDYIMGAKLAFERLIKPKFKVGDKIIGNDLATSRYGFTKAGSKGTVVGYSGPFSNIIRVDFDVRTFANSNALGFNYEKTDYIAKGWCVDDECFNLAEESSEAPKAAPPFKVGDIVIGLNYSEGLPHYCITGKKAISKVVAVSSETEIRVKLLHPNGPNHFIFIGSEYYIDARTVKKWKGFDVGTLLPRFVTKTI